MSTVAGDFRGILPGLSWRARHVKGLIWQTVLVGGAALSEMSFLDHLEELRTRIIKSLIAVAIGMTISIAYSAELIRFLRIPAATLGIPVIVIEATEVFSLYFRVAMSGGICLAAPFILWQTWRFIEPGLYPPERRYAGPFLISTTFCFAAGGIFAYVIVAPWFLSLQKEMAIRAGLTVEMTSLSYFGLLTTLVVSVGAIFEMPPVVFILSRIGLVTAGFLVRNFKYAILLFSLAAAVLTPSTQIPEMIAFMGMMTAVYLVSIVVAWIFARKRTSGDKNA